ncbi:simple sugar transport system ATP-binding protein [Gemmobacter aquatilis]|uniref:Simple sugar transport system ATP-binding protein n=1 Tax=Gemmobacter aquatilis TaxID=933059 RepID=A0A1H7Y7I0_9RHOB|nr:sugar ABC transporter ATP-binding protein [Gemmobacter aquatilis]SEM41943.1 simple sugar transport system ATP-binding protein [Gemmobacter aquatilis]
MQAAEGRPVLEARGIVKIFGQHTALGGVDFELKPGEVHALLGENGAGKSTLIKILTGAYQPDHGEMLLDGVPVSFRDPLQAQGHGIGTVYQEVNLLPNRSVAENLFLGRQPTRFGLIRRREIEARARRLLADYGLEIDVRADLSDYSVAVQQIVAIARAVELSGKVLVLDEPTASLDRNEVERLFDVVRKLKARGLGIVFITHFLGQVFELCDRVTILRNGRKIATQSLQGLSATDVVRMMLGKDVAFDHHPTGVADARRGAARVTFRNLGRKGSVAPVTLSVHEGEVVGVAGLLGSGRTEVARLMFGVDAADSGEILVDGTPVTIRNPAQAVAAGFGFCPEDRKIDGIFGELSVRENIIIALQAKLGWFRALNREDQVELAGRHAEALDIRAASPDMPVKLLSGGNQQKVILARWLAIDPSFLILDEPTRGIDVGAHAEIVRTINRLREDGLALFAISSELEEVVAYSNRVVVMRDREMVAELSGAAVAPDAIVQAIAETPAPEAQP